MTIFATRTLYFLFFSILPLSAHTDFEEEKSSLIPSMIDVPKATFIMGSHGSEKGESDELPQHSVTLSPHQIGKYEITNGQYSAALNWAQKKGYLQPNPFKPFEKDPGNVFLHGRLLIIINKDTQIIRENGRFMPIMRDGLFMDDHPVVDVTWSGAAAYTNWISEIEGLTPCYAPESLKLFTPLPDGYRLPTEAEWEHASGSQYYSTSTDTLTHQQANYQLYNPMGSLGMSSYPYTSSIGYFDGHSVGTVDSPSPIGCYDMSGNVQEWCEDWFSSYKEDHVTDPSGPAGRGQFKIVRGGAWNSMKSTCRSTNRGWTEPSNHFRSFGFRVARTPVQK